ncbi:MAG: DUF2252 domain-containing protein [Burkholderiales bacterium]
MKEHTRHDAKVARESRASVGRDLRKRVGRATHAKVAAGRRDPIALLEASSRGRVRDLVPIRYGRMLQSPFTFLRGSAAVMAHDLARTPSTGVQAQICGDCHLLNFGLFASPERQLVFDINDFDETHPGPWEWDLKRLAASFVVAARDAGISDAKARDIVVGCARAYRECMARVSHLAPLEVWYEKVEWQQVIEMAPDAKARKFREQVRDQAKRRIVDHLFPKITQVIDGKARLVDQPPLIFHVDAPDYEERVAHAFAAYRASLSDDRRVLLDRYRLVDFAVKVVGIGSVGTRCYIALLLSAEDHPLFLQFKEAVTSVLEPYTQRCTYGNQGQRVVMGQRLMQSTSDIFLGWSRDAGQDFYVRQLRDMKFSVPLDGFNAVRLARYAHLCGHTLARSHARSADAATVAGYLGKGDPFEEALATFAIAYADQTEKDHAALVKAVRSGRIHALRPEG